MEVIKNNNNKTRRCPKTNGIMAAIMLIVVGLVFLGRNLGYVDSYLFRIIVSWQMLLIALGLWSIFRRQYSGGLILLVIGGFFIIPRIIGIDGGWIRIYWPVLLVALGVILIIKKFIPQCNSRHKGQKFRDIPHNSGDGYLHSDNTFGSVRHIILDPVFKGGTIRNNFAGTIVDFRGTQLGSAETYIDVDCIFGGIEIYAPSSWCIISELKPVVGGYSDKRYLANSDADYMHKLIIRGNLTFSGVEVKN